MRRRRIRRMRSRGIARMWSRRIRWPWRRRRRRHRPRRWQRHRMRCSVIAPRRRAIRLNLPLRSTRPRHTRSHRASRLTGRRSPPIARAIRTRPPLRPGRRRARNRDESVPHYRLMVYPIHRKVPHQRRANNAAAPGGISVTNRLQRFHRMPSDGVRPSGRIQRDRRNPHRNHRHNRMHPIRPPDRQRMRTITQWRSDDIDHINRAPKTPSAEPAVHPRHPTPAKPTPIRPVPAPIRSPPPPIPRSPHISGPRRPHPASIPIRIKFRIRSNLRLPHRPLPRNVIPAPVGIQIRPSIALISRKVIPRRRPVRSLIHRRLITLLIPAIPGIRQYLRRQIVTAVVRDIRRKRLTRPYIHPVPPGPVHRGRPLHLSTAGHHRDLRGRLVEIDPNRSVLQRRNHIPPA